MASDQIPHIDEGGKYSDCAELQARIAKLEELAESGKLDADAELRESCLDEMKHKRRTRIFVTFIALAVLLGMGWILCLEVGSVLNGEQQGIPDSVRIAMFVAPIVSITAIIVFLIVGAFRGYQRNDFGDLPISSVARETFRQTSG